MVAVAVCGQQARTSEMDAEILPVASRLLTAYAQARQAWQALDLAGDDAKRAQAAKDTMDALDPVQERHRGLCARLRFAVAVTGKIDLRGLAPSPAP